jgi:hypothetical protein
MDGFVIGFKRIPSDKSGQDNSLKGAESSISRLAELLRNRWSYCGSFHGGCNSKFYKKILSVLLREPKVLNQLFDRLNNPVY